MANQLEIKIITKKKSLIERRTNFWIISVKYCNISDSFTQMLHKSGRFASKLVGLNFIYFLKFLCDNVSHGDVHAVINLVNIKLNAPEFESLDSGSVYLLTGRFLCSHQGPNDRTLGCQMFVSSTIKHYFYLI